jgi:magnesium transporter
VNVREASVGLLYRKRFPWLMLLILVNIVSGSGIAFFEETIAAAFTLVIFLPLLIDSGGNAGSQSATQVIRSMATGDVQIKDWLALFTKEITVAASIGLTLGLAVSLVGIWRGGLQIGVVVALSMIAVVLVGSLVGLSLPFALSRLNLDPAIASAPLVTSIADIAGVLIYFSIATWYLGLQ